MTRAVFARYLRAMEITGYKDYQQQHQPCLAPHSLGSMGELPRVLQKEGGAWPAVQAKPGLHQQSFIPGKITRAHPAGGLGLPPEPCTVHRESMLDRTPSSAAVATESPQHSMAPVL